MNGEIVILCGYPAGGKSTLVQEFVDRDFHRINRDETGGGLSDQNTLIKQAHEKGLRWLVLDNTYLTKESRKAVIDIGKELGLPVRCVWLKTSFEDAQFNACLRMIHKTGKLLNLEEIKNAKNPNLFPPAALFAARKKFEGEGKKVPNQFPSKDEGFSVIEERPFVRKWPSDYTNKAILLDFDDTIRRSVGPKQWPEKPEHVVILPNRKTVLTEYQKNYRLVGVSNQSAVAKGLPIEDCRACFEETLKQLDLRIDYAFCPHRIPPVSCYCRKPSTGLGAYFIVKYKLNPSKCVMVGDSTSDATFASRCGFSFQKPDEFFGE